MKKKVPHGVKYLCVLTIATTTLLDAKLSIAETILADSSNGVNLSAVNPSENNFIIQSGTTIIHSARVGNAELGTGSKQCIINNAGNLKGDTGIRLGSGLAGSTIKNSGIIIGTGNKAGGQHAGIASYVQGTVVNQQVGLIASNSDGMFLSNANTVVENYGTIKTNITAVYFDNSGSFYQGSTGVLETYTTPNPAYGNTYGVLGNRGTLIGVNEGKIDVTGHGVWYRTATGTFDNSGIISGGDTGVFIDRAN